MLWVCLFAFETSRIQRGMEAVFPELCATEKNPADKCRDQISKFSHARKNGKKSRTILASFVAVRGRAGH